MPGALLDARVAVLGEGTYFTGAPLFHPREVNSDVRRVLWHARKQQLPGEARTHLQQQLALRRLRADRYPRAATRKLYADLVPPKRFFFF